MCWGRLKKSGGTGKLFLEAAKFYTGGTEIYSEGADLRALSFGAMGTGITANISFLIIGWHFG